MQATESYALRPQKSKGEVNAYPYPIGPCRKQPLATISAHHAAVLLAHGESLELCTAKMNGQVKVSVTNQNIDPTHQAKATDV